MGDKLEDMVQHWLIALKKIQHNKVRVARYYNKKVVSKQLIEGDLVWQLILPIGSKDNRFDKWSPT